MPSDELKPCPFCRGGWVVIVGTDKGVWAKCFECDAQGPRHPEADAALESWNRATKETP